MSDAAVTDADLVAARSALSTLIRTGACHPQWREDDVEVLAQFMANVRERSHDQGYALCNRHCRR